MRTASRLLTLAGLVSLCWMGHSRLPSQEPRIVDLPAIPAPTGVPFPAQAADDVVPKGIEVLARGPVHEAFATPTAEARATPLVNKKPPLPIEEMPPEERPDGEVVWIGGYWSWDDDRQDYLWVSGCWRVKPEGKDWVPGYWRESAGNWQWAPGFWANAAQERRQEITYYPEPPPPPQLAPAGEAPNAETIYVPGHWQWLGARYVWRAGHWARGRPGFVYVPAHYRWTPFGFVFVSGYWDLAVPRRGVLYAPVVVNPVLVGPRFVYTPYYAVSDVVVLDALFIHPHRCHYYFGDYYGPRYRSLGFESCVVYSRRHYDSLVVYQRWENRANPRWLDVQINLTFARDSGRAPVPPRTLVQQTTVVNNVTNITIQKNVTNNVTVNNNIAKTTVLAPTRNVVAARGNKTVVVDAAARTQAQESAKTIQQTVGLQRQKTEGAGVMPKDKATPRTTAFQRLPSEPLAPAAGQGAGGPSAYNSIPGKPPLANTGNSGAPAGGLTAPQGTSRPNSLGSTVKPPGTMVNSPGVGLTGPGGKKSGTAPFSGPAKGPMIPTTTSDPTKGNASQTTPLTTRPIVSTGATGKKTLGSPTGGTSTPPGVGPTVSTRPKFGPLPGSAPGSNPGASSGSGTPPPAKGGNRGKKG